MEKSIIQTNLSSLAKIYEGKVRDIYEVDDKHILICTTDRVSAFDVILPNGIPGKGKVLTGVANFWFTQMEPIIGNHLSDIQLADLNLTAEEQEQLEGRSIIVKKLNALPVEAIVRGYLLGSGWKDYQATGNVCGIELPANLQLASKLEQPLFTPSTKAEVGDHDINIDFAKMKRIIGSELAEKVRDVSLKIYQHAADYALERGVIIADTKFEFGLDDDGELILIDEILTPDSSRFWAKESWQEGVSPPSFDKQIVRDYLETLDWDKTAPGPELPKDIVDKTASQYKEVARRLLGNSH
jgi:phosphoribosylaminoimidazole-succinocarboxamide synthase